MLTPHQLNSFVLARLILCPIVVFYIIINAPCSFLGVQLSVIPIIVFALKVVNTISNVACFLYLCQECACAYRVNAPCRQIEHIAFTHFVFAQSIGYGIVFHHCFILLGSYVVL